MTNVDYLKMTEMPLQTTRVDVLPSAVHVHPALSAVAACPHHECHIPSTDLDIKQFIQQTVKTRTPHYTRGRLVGLGFRVYG